MLHQWSGGKCERCRMTADIATIECPGRIATEVEMRRVRLGTLDYSGGKWRQYVSLIDFVPRNSGGFDGDFRSAKNPR